MLERQINNFLGQATQQRTLRERFISCFLFLFLHTTRAKAHLLMFTIPNFLPLQNLPLGIVSLVAQT
jgi:hypothetical protein